MDTGQDPRAGFSGLIVIGVLQHHLDMIGDPITNLSIFQVIGFWPLTVIALPLGLSLGLLHLLNLLFTIVPCFSPKQDTALLK